ncbi:hypothetical protein J4423_01905 [Candidatus Pacearchaeota archaeon]|nr:hypothetical protein [Candidatus Pacearchaeota archaeon]
MTSFRTCIIITIIGIIIGIFLKTSYSISILVGILIGFFFIIYNRGYTNWSYFKKHFFSGSVRILSLIVINVILGVILFYFQPTSIYGILGKLSLAIIAEIIIIIATIILID